MILATVFDFDGILADTEELHFQSYQVIMEAEGHPLTYEAYAERYMAFDSRGCLKQWALDFGLTPSEKELGEWVEAKNDAFEALVTTQDVQPLPGAVNAVRLASEHGPVGICTGAVLRDIQALVKTFGLLEFLSTIVTADDVTVSKPDPACYRLTAERLNIAAENCLAIEDTPGGLQAAKGAGYTTLGVTTTHERADLAPYADRLRDTLVGFSKQDLI